MPFIFLVVGLLGGGLVCLLVLNTILASGSFQLTSLQQANTSLAQRQQMLQQQIAEEESPGALATEARKLGMVPVRQPRFVNLKNGRIYGSSGTRGAGR
jgi:cell division protein FtsB